MNDRHYREEISARADGEDPGVPFAVIDEHLRSCVSCRSFESSIRHIGGHQNSGDAQPLAVDVAGHDISAQIVSSIAKADRALTLPVVRWLLGISAAFVVMLAIPDFLAGGEHAHSLRHMAAFRLAYAVGLFTVVLRPARARTMLHVAVVLVAALAATSIADLFSGNAEWASESIHLIQVLTAVLLWILTRPGTGRRRVATGEQGDRTAPTAAWQSKPGLHVVGD